MMSPIFVVLIAMIIVSAGTYVNIEHRIFLVYSVCFKNSFKFYFLL